MSDNCLINCLNEEKEMLGFGVKEEGEGVGQRRVAASSRRSKIGRESRWRGAKLGWGGGID